jgi:hypothetical protein
MRIKRPDLGGSGYEYLGGTTNTVDGHTKAPISETLPTQRVTRPRRPAPEERIARAKDLVTAAREGSPADRVKLGEAALEFLQSKGLDVGPDGRFDLQQAASIVKQTFGLNPNVAFTAGTNIKDKRTKKPADGGFNPDPDRVLIRPDLSPALTALVLLHEGQHAADTEFGRSKPPGAPEISRGGHFLESGPDDTYGRELEPSVVSTAVLKPDQLQSTPYALPPGPDLSTPEAMNAYLLKKLQGQN